MLALSTGAYFATAVSGLLIGLMIAAQLYLRALEREARDQEEEDEWLDPPKD